MSLTSPPAELACPSPSVDANGNITFSPPGQAQFVGTVANYQCSTGFNLIGIVMSDTAKKVEIGMEQDHLIKVSHTCFMEDVTLKCLFLLRCSLFSSQHHEWRCVLH